MAIPKLIWTPTKIAELVLTREEPTWNAINAVAVALAESGGDVHAINLVINPRNKAHMSLDLSLWQVNTYWHPELSIADSFDPVKQWEYVEVLSRGRGWKRDWTKWVTWNTGIHASVFGRARNAVNAAAGTDL